MYSVEEIVEQAKNNPEFKKSLKESFKTGKRGRPALPEHLKVKKEAAGGKRGRPALSEEEKAKREQEKANKPKGKRGRPAKVESPEVIQARIAELQNQLTSTATV